MERVQSSQSGSHDGDGDLLWSWGQSVRFTTAVDDDWRAEEDVAELLLGEVVRGEDVDILYQVLQVGEDLQSTIEWSPWSRVVHAPVDRASSDHSPSRAVRPHHSPLEGGDTRVDHDGDELMGMEMIMREVVQGPVVQRFFHLSFLVDLVRIIR